MASHTLKLAIVLTFGHLFLAPSLAKDDAKNKSLWSQKMQQLSGVLQQMLPILASDKPLDASTTKKLQTNVKQLRGLAHSINMGPDAKVSPLPPDADPSIQFISSMFEREVKHADAALSQGNAQYAKNSLRLVTSYCISCHTRDSKGPQFQSLFLPKELDRLPRIERARLYAATRQFDRALKEFDTVIADPKMASQQPLEWGRAVRHAFSIAIRVKQDPSEAEKVLKKVDSLKTTPPLFKEYVTPWKKSVAEWKKETGTKFDSEAAFLKRAGEISEQARNLQKYPMDHSADVLYLRVSALAHEQLSRFPTGKKASEALFLAGESYDLLDDHLISPLPEMYYEACIRRSPHTPIAAKCFERYQANVYFGYTGSAGTSIPREVVQLLNELRTLAKKKG